MEALRQLGPTSRTERPALDEERRPAKTCEGGRHQGPAFQAGLKQFSCHFKQDTVLPAAYTSWAQRPPRPPLLCAQANAKSAELVSALLEMLAASQAAPAAEASPGEGAEATSGRGCGSVAQHSKPPIGLQASLRCSGHTSCILTASRETQQQCASRCIGGMRTSRHMSEPRGASLLAGRAALSTEATHPAASGPAPQSADDRGAEAAGDDGSIGRTAPDHTAETSRKTAARGSPAQRASVGGGQPSPLQSAKVLAADTEVGPAAARPPAQADTAAPATRAASVGDGRTPCCAGDAELAAAAAGEAAAATAEVTLPSDVQFAGRPAAAASAPGATPAAVHASPDLVAQPQPRAASATASAGAGEAKSPLHPVPSASATLPQQRRMTVASSGPAALRERLPESPAEAEPASMNPSASVAASTVFTNPFFDADPAPGSCTGTGDRNPTSGGATENACGGGAPGGSPARQARGSADVADSHEEAGSPGELQCFLYYIRMQKLLAVFMPPTKSDVTSVLSLSATQKS